MNNIMFQIGIGEGSDYSNRVIAGTYSVQKIEIYTTWEDANGRTHRAIYREKTSGSFNMLFKTLEEYKAFCSRINNTKQNDGSCPCTVLDNLTDTQVTSDFFISFTPKRDRDGMWEDKFGTITINIEER